MAYCCWSFLQRLRSKGFKIPAAPPVTVAPAPLVDNSEAIQQTFEPVDQAVVRLQVDEDRSMPDVGLQDSFNWGSTCRLIGACTELCGRSSQEDLMDVYQVGQATIMAVYDGHGGTEAVTMLKRLAREHIHSIADLKQEVFDNMDCSLMAHLRTVATADDANDTKALTSGAVAVFAVVEGKRLGIANIGDCRAILGEQEMHPERGLIIKGRQVTEDHNCNNAMERERLAEAGQLVDNYCGGHLEVTRAFGDMLKKTSNKLPGLSVQAQVLPIMEIHDGMEFLILMCDGVVEMCTPQVAANAVRASLRSPSGGTAQAAVSQLVRRCKRTAQDNATAVMMVLNMPPPRPVAGPLPDDLK